ncbi:hypothetical protein [Nitriliruptor alkaliphilus]|uniref:hypothetical protein n=1 Tax=Nitriliruptor alkaliphilus TaxID=427918 RepID=UPI000698CA0B|nr:hypothetical protein [Nitriliruptor alkaliphilus]
MQTPEQAQAEHRAERARRAAEIARLRRRGRRGARRRAAETLRRTAARLDPIRPPATAAAIEVASPRRASQPHLPTRPPASERASGRAELSRPRR